MELILASIALCICPVQTGAHSAALDRAIKFCERVAPTYRVTFHPSDAAIAPRLPGESGGLVLEADGCQYFFDPSGSSLRSFMNGKRLQTINLRKSVSKNKLFNSDKAIWKRAETIADTLIPGGAKLSHGAMTKDPPGVASPQGYRGRVTVEFGANPFGYPSQLGPQLSIQLDPTDGQLLGMSRPRVDLHYVRPKVTLTKDEAITRGKAVVIQAKGDKNAKPLRMELVYVLPNSEFMSKKGAELGRKHISRLCYSIAWLIGITNIDSETGECLGGTIVGKSYSSPR